MKSVLKRLIPCLLFLAMLHARGDVVVAVNPRITGGGSQGDAIAMVMLTQLSLADGLKLVERDALRSILDEMKLGVQGLSDTASAARIGNIAGAHYFGHAGLIRSDDQVMATVKAIQIETTQTRLNYTLLPADAGVVEIGTALAASLEALVAALETERGQPGLAAAPEAKEIPAEWARPVVMVIIPEMHVRQPELIDPAAETEIMKRLLAAGFRVIDSEYVQMMKTDREEARTVFGSLKTAAAYAAGRGVDVLLYGEAISELGASLGDFRGCRGRVELKAIETAGEAVLLSDSAEGGATDISETIAGKKAIQHAANRLADHFLHDLAEKWNQR